VVRDSAGRGALEKNATVQGYLAHKKHPPVGPYSRPMPKALGRSAVQAARDLVFFSSFTRILGDM